MMETAALITALAAGFFGALAYGYRGQRDQEREQVVWLRKELADVRKPPPPTPLAPPRPRPPRPSRR